MIAPLSPRELAAWRSDAAREAPVLVDVREPWEYAICRIEGSVHMPLQTIPSRAGELPRDKDLVLICHHGNRSRRAAQWLENNGFARLHNLEGGVEDWANDVEPAMAHY